MKKLGMKNIPRTVWGIFWTFTVISAGNYISQFMSLYLTGKLGLATNASGTIVSLAGIISMPGIILGGRLSDAWGRKKSFILFQVMAIVVTLVIVLGDNNKIIIAMVILNSFFISAIHPICTATIFQATNEENQKDGLALFMIAMYVGYMISDLGCAIGFARHYKLLFLMEAVMKAISIFIFYRMVELDEEPQSLVKSKKEQNKESGKDIGFVYILLKNPMLLLFSISCCLFSVMYTQSAYSLPIQLNATYDEKGSFYYGIIMIINSIIIVVGTRIISKLLKGHDVLNVILLSVLFVGSGMGILYIGTSIPFCLISVILWSTAYIINTPYSAAYIESYAPKDMLGRFAAWIKMVTGAGYAFGPVLFGNVIQRNGVQSVWSVCILFMLINLIILSIIKVRASLTYKKV